jgi:hypothetical protein
MRRVGVNARVTTRWRRGIGLVIGVAAVAVLVACGRTQPGAGTPRGPNASSISPVGQASTPSLAVRIRISLDQTRAIAGHPIRGQAVLTNTTAKPILVRACARDGWLFVGLTNATIPFDPAIAAAGCAPSVRLAPGTNRFPITVQTTYQECLAPGGQSLTPMPACTLHGPPPLPAGAYTTAVVTVGLPAGTPTAPPIHVTLLPPP